MLRLNVLVQQYVKNGPREEDSEAKKEEQFSGEVGEEDGLEEHPFSNRRFSTTFVSPLTGVPAGSHFACLACLAGPLSGQSHFVSFEPFVVSRIEVHGVRGAGVAGDSTGGNGGGRAAGAPPLAARQDTMSGLIVPRCMA
jgi:hypothetical protein